MGPRSDLDAQEGIEVPREVGHALKALADGTANDAQQKKAYAFILYGLCGVDRASFVHAEDSQLTMAWREGRRFVGRWLRQIVEAPFADPPEVKHGPPRMRSTTEIVEGPPRSRNEGEG